MNPSVFTRAPPPGFVGAMLGPNPAPVRRPAPPPPRFPPPQLPALAAHAAGPVYGGGSFLAYLLSDLPTYTTSPRTVTANSFIDQLCSSGAGEEELKMRRLAHLVADKWMHSYESLVYPPPVVAASAIFLARLVLPGFCPWTPELQELTGITDNDLDECVHAMNQFCDPRSLLLGIPPPS